MNSQISNSTSSVRDPFNVACGDWLTAKKDHEFTYRTTKILVIEA